MRQASVIRPYPFVEVRLVDSSLVYSACLLTFAGGDAIEELSKHGSLTEALSRLDDFAGRLRTHA